MSSRMNERSMMNGKSKVIERSEYRNLRVIVLITALILTCAVFMTSCGADDIDVSGYADQKIALIGLPGSSGSDEPVYVTPADLKAMKCKTLKTESTSDKIGKVRATGPELDTVLEQYGCSKADFSKIIINGSDEYDVKLLNDYITSHDIYLAIGIDGEPLDEESIPCRIIIPESDSAYWVRMVSSIEFVK